ncbi:hypothetical protein PY32053_01919 [Paracoccus yeei]|uniref:Uncharacterized protein n=1 Tax=Paracoccus yeei TaxID=147645 RepID=A0A386UP05_9RHOB|nr:hypothetical protein PY32053_01919 [Paracoccus yeei]
MTLPLGTKRTTPKGPRIIVPGTKITAPPILKPGG